MYRSAFVPKNHLAVLPTNRPLSDGKAAPLNSRLGPAEMQAGWFYATATRILQQPNEHRHLAVLHFPYGRQPKGRSEEIQTWINSTSNNNTTKNRMSYWQQGKLGFGGTQSRKTWHYACGLGRIHMRNDVVMSIELCTDEADTAYIRAITTLHFDAFGVQSQLLRSWQWILLYFFGANGPICIIGEGRVNCNWSIRLYREFPHAMLCGIFESWLRDE